MKNEAPLFSIVLITKNESKVLSRCLNSLSDFFSRGGEVVILDTGSTDNTIQIATDYGCTVQQLTCDIHVKPEEVKEINSRFVAEGETPIMQEGDIIFNFSYARNHATRIASNDFIISLDADEVYKNFDIDQINQYIKDGAEQLDYLFIYSHNPDGTPSMQFNQSKAYDRRKFKWSGIIHEVLQGSGKTVHVPSDIITLEHFQEPVGDHRGKYIKGLAYDCYKDPSNDRHRHYLARDMMYAGMYKSAISQFLKHIEIGKWMPEVAQSWVFIGDCRSHMKDLEGQRDAYHRAIEIDSSRREPYLKMAWSYLYEKKYQHAVCYAKAALEIPKAEYYMNQMSHYQEDPYRILYQAYGWLGRISDARDAINKALEYKPYDQMLLSHCHYYLDLPTIQVVIPHLDLGIKERIEGLERCKKSIADQNYPQNKIIITVVEGNETVPQKVKHGITQSDSDYIVYAANDMYFAPNDFITAVLDAKRFDKSLVVFDTGIRNDEGYICEHFLIHREAVGYLDKREIFDTDFIHAGCDDWLWYQMKCDGKAMISTNTHPTHSHFGRDTHEYDDVYKKGWEHVEKDRETLKRKIEAFKGILP